MSTQVETTRTQAYKSGVTLLAQQKGSRFRPYVRVEENVVDAGGKRAAFDQIGATSARKRTTRHADTPQIDTPHARRWITLSPYEWADLIDKPDMLRTIHELTNPYQINGALAMTRAMDDEVIANAFASTVTGEDGSGTDAFDTTNYRIAVGGAGLTLTKLMTAKEILDGAENDPDMPRAIACSAKQITNLLATTEVKSADYNTVKALVQGQIDTFMGFKFIRTQRLLTDASGYRRVIAWCRDSLLLGIGVDIKGRVDERPDKSYSTQVYVSMDIGACRMDQTGVVEILCSE